MREQRGSLSQQRLADEMRARGFEWAQATVWNVEMGKRPVRLTEAIALADIHGIELADFVDQREGARIRAKRDVERAEIALRKAQEKWAEVQ